MAKKKHPGLRRAVAEALGHTYAAAYGDAFELANNDMVDRFLRLLEVDGFVVLVDPTDPNVRLEAALEALKALAQQGCVGHTDHPVGSPPCPYRTPMEFARKAIAEIGQING
jgi:hypothetical protein